MQLFEKLMRFIGISGLGWIFDFAIFTILSLLWDNLIVCNFFSSLIAIIFVFFVSVRKTFIQNKNGIDIKFKFLLYFFYQLILISTVSKILLYFKNFLVVVLTSFSFSNYAALLAKILITPITIIVNFLVMRLLIEKI